MVRKFASVMLLVAWGCADAPQDEPTSSVTANDYLNHGTPADLEPVIVAKSGGSGLPSRFDRNQVMEDAFFNASDAVTPQLVQAFLERNPYGTRTFLADVRVSGKSAAEAIVDGSRAKGVNPIVMIARMQVEKSLIAKTSSPGGNAVDFAFGCGCPDNRPCNEAYRGLEKQIECAANTLRRRYDESVAGNGIWNRGVAKRTLDPLSVTPANHATASLYAYTPWVLEGRGGNWLVWNITRRFEQHFQSLGPVEIPDGEAPPGGGERPADPWIGDECAADQCSFGGGFCVENAAGGVCSAACEGFCPDRSGAVTTFCVDGSELGGAGGGLCAVKADSRNGNCVDLGLVAKQLDRHVGSSGVARRTARVCVFAEVEAPAPPPAPPEAGCPEDLNAGGICEGDTVVYCSDGDVRRVDCAETGGTCVSGPAGARCRAGDQPPPPAPPAPEDGCGDVDARGTCEGDVATRCVDGALQELDCAGLGQSCGAGRGGAACAPTRTPLREADPRCPAIGFAGECQGNVAVWCESDNSHAVDCAWYGGTCGWAEDGNGWWCR